MKTLVKKCFRSLGYEITRVKRPAAGISGSSSAVEHNSREQREHFYSDAGQVANYLSAERRQFYREVAEFLIVAVPDFRDAKLRVADYGCGPGMLLKQLSELSPRSQFFGYDFASSGISIARNNLPAAEFMERDIYQEFPDRYDLILCTEVLEHLEHPKKALRNLLGQLASGGRLLLTVPDGRMDQYTGHIHFWSPESWKLFLADACNGCKFETGHIAGGTSRAYLYASIAGPAGQAAFRPASEVVRRSSRGVAT